jgi:hypothetical protein
LRGSTSGKTGNQPKNATTVDLLLLDRSTPLNAQRRCYRQSCRLLRRQLETEIINKPLDFETMLARNAEIRSRDATDESRRRTPTTPGRPSAARAALPAVRTDRAPTGATFSRCWQKQKAKRTKKTKIKASGTAAHSKHFYLIFQELLKRGWDQGQSLLAPGGAVLSQLAIGLCVLSLARFRYRWDPPEGWAAAATAASAEEPVSSLLNGGLT